MNNNKADAIELASNETGSASENEKGLHNSKDNGDSKRNFGVLNLWSIRRGARIYRIHNRIPRL